MKDHFVYFVQAGNYKNSPVKIGVTHDIDKRILTLQTGNPYKLKCNALIHCESESEAYSLEGYLHKKLKSSRMCGEWFKSDYFNLKEILKSYSVENRGSESKSNYKDGVHETITIRKLMREVKELKSELKKRSY